MSEASNHVIWCLNKAKKEIEKVEELLGICQDMIKNAKGIVAK